MNHVYRLCWNAAASQWVAATELAHRSRSGAGSLHAATAHPSRLTRTALALALALGVGGLAQAGQTGGQIVAGAGSITQAGAVTTITQNSQQLSLAWQSFNIGAGETVDFVQPGASSIAVNRVLGNSASEIFGKLNANGQVWLINPNGVLFGPSAQVHVGGIVASTLDTSDASMFSASRSFSGESKASVVNQGTINAGSGGYVALLGHHVANEGSIGAHLGTVAMGAGSAITLTFEGNQLLHLQVDRSTLDDLVENRQLVQADGGRVLLTAGAAESLLASSVNNTGVVRAQTVDNRNGEITLLAGATAGTVHVGGTIDASAPSTGAGGFIETSAAHIDIAGDAQINASAANGTSGTWLIDPVDLTIDTAAATTISGALDGGTNVTELTTSTTASGSGMQTTGAGDINVDAPITWTNAAATLTLDAFHSVNVNAAINGAGPVLMQAGADIKLAAAGTVSGNAGVTLKAQGNFINNAGAGALTAAAGRWLVYSTSPASDTRGGLASNFIQYAMATTGTPTASGNGFVYRVTPTVNITGLTGSVIKTYDGNADAALTGSHFTSTGLLGGDTIASAAGSYASANAGTAIAVTSPSTSADFSFAGASGATVYGYQLSGLPRSANIGTINPKALTVSIVNTPTKIYNATTTAMLVAGNYQTNGVVAGESVSFSQPSAVSYDSANAGARTVTATFLPSNFVGNGSTRLANYILPTTATGAGLIKQAPLELMGLLAQDKTYDGNAIAQLVKGGAGIFGVVAGDAGSVGLDSSAGTALFASANAGTWAVTASGFTLTGAKAANYQLIAPGDLKATINKKAVTLGNVSAQDKVYDATTAAALDVSSATLGGVLAAETANVTLAAGGSGSFDSANVGNGRAVTTSGYALTGTGAGNYSLTQPVGLSANIAPAPLTIAVTGNPTRLYNGTATALVGESDVTINGFKGSDAGRITQNAGATYASPNASNTNLVTVLLEAPDFVMSQGSLSNYSFAAQVYGNGTISPIALDYAIVGNPTKIYNATTDATLTPANYKLGGFLAGEGAKVTQRHGTYADPNAGQWLVTANLRAVDFTPLGSTNLVNYVLPTLVTGIGTIKPESLGGTLVYASINGPIKVYDGTTAATLTSSNFILTGFVGVDGATINQTVGIFSDKNVGRQAVSAVLGAGNFDATGTTDLTNYTLPTMAYGTGEITPTALTASITGNPTKVYDGGTYVALGLLNYQLDGFALAEGATVNPPTAVHFNNKNVGTPGVTAELANSSYIADLGTLLSNYILPTQATGVGTITRAPLYVIGVSAQSRVYDTTTVAQLSGSGSLVGLVVADRSAVALTSGSTGTFAQADVGTSLSVTANGFSISGAESGNYLLQPLTGLRANITPFKLSISGVTAQDKDYDATTKVTLDSNAANVSGVFAADSANVTLDTAGAAGSTRSANVGNGLAVTTSGFALSGTQAHNYTVDQVSGLTMNISPKALTATIIGDPTKPYDGSNSVTLTSTNFALSGFAGSEDATVPQSANAFYNDVNAGSNRGLTANLVVSDFLAKAGTSLSNYTLPTTALGTQGTITPAVISLQGTRVYNALTNADASLFTSGGVISGVNGEKLTLTGSGVLTTKNVGSQQPFANIGSLVLGANGGSNVANYTLTGGVDWVTITPALLHISGLGADDRAYDGNRTATLNGTATDDRLGSDVLSFGNIATGTFDTKNVGIAKAVTTAITLGGTDAGNYTLVQPTGIKANVTAKAIAVVAAGVNKVYNGNLTSTATLSSVGKVGADALTYTNTSNVFASKDVANGIGVTVSGIGLAGADAGNYTLTSNTATTVANITPYIINLSGTRVYNALTNVDFSLLGNHDGTVNGVAGEKLTLTGAGVLADKNVGTNKSFAQGSLALVDNGTYLASNYAFGTRALTVTKADLTVSGTVAANKIYDGNRDAALSGSVLDGVLLSDVLTLGGTTLGTFDTKDVGNNKPVSTAFTISGTDAANYNITQPTGITANITPLGVSVVVKATGKDKVYDGSTHSDATLDSTDFVTGDDVGLADTSNEFASKDVGNNIAVSINGIYLTGTNASNYSLASNTATTTANITPYVIGLTGTRVYDATTDANWKLFGNHDGTINGIAGEQLALSGSGTLGNKNIGDQKALTALNTLALGNHGSALAGNYTFTGGTHWVTVTPYTLAVTATAANKVYDGQTTAGVTLAHTSLLGTDVVNVSYASASFSDKNVANGKTVTVNNIAATGADAGNYSFNASTTTTADITPLAITGAIAAGNKIYDATTGATTSGTLSGVLGGDVLGFTTIGNFSDKNAANGKTVNVSGSLTGTDKVNYTLTTNATTTANITPLAVSVSTTAQNKVYDGNRSAIATLASGGILAGDTVSFGGDPATFSDKNAANGKTVTVNGIAAAGVDAGNYTYNLSATTTANITPLGISGAITAANKVYDATTGTTTSGTLSGVIAGDTLTFGTSGSFADKNVATDKAVNVTGSLGGTDAGNYTLTTNATTTADITPLAITGAIVASDKVYDATAGATTTGTLSGAIGGDLVTFGTSGVFLDKHVANGKTVNVTGSLAGTDKNNYTLTTNATTTADITPLAISGAITAADKTYDGTTVATITGALTGTVLAGDDLGVSSAGSFVDENAGSGKTVNVSGALTGADRGNYTLSANTTTTADISQKVLDLSGTRVYDGSTLAAAGMFGSGGIVDGVAGEQLALTGAGVLTSKNVATNQALAGSGTLALGDRTGALASNYTLLGGNHLATITPLGVVGAITAANKVYDATTVASISGSLSGGLVGDDLSLSSSGSFADKNAGTGKTVNVSGSLGGADAGNYALTTNTATTAYITPLAISGSIVAGNKVYDGSTAASTSGRLTGSVLAGDQLGINAAGTFADKNVGDGKSVRVTGTLSGADAGNYTLAVNTSTTADITPLAITGAITAADKVYDATTDAITAGMLIGAIDGDALDFHTSGTFSDKNAGDAKTVNVESDLGGADAGNYALTANTTTTADITPLAITGDITAANKVYDGTTAATLSGTLAGVLAGDDLGLSSVGSFVDKNVGSGKTVDVSGSLSGADAGNYTLLGNASTVADITPLSISVDATGTDKYFDGKRDATALLTGHGVLQGDAVSFDSASRWFADPAPGNNKPITVSDIVASGADAGNYVFNTTATTSANILPLANRDASTGPYAQLGWLLRPIPLATPYGLASALGANPFAGNQKLRRQPVEPNAARVDFYSGLALRIVDGGVAAPRDAL